MLKSLITMLLLLALSTTQLHAQTCVANATNPAGKCEAIEQDVAAFQAASGAIDVFVDGQKVASAVAPFIKNGRTYVEMAAIFRALNADVRFESMPIGRITAVRND